MLWQKGRGRLGSQESAAVICVGEIVVESGGGWLVWENGCYRGSTGEKYVRYIGSCFWR